MDTRESVKTAFVFAGGGSFGAIQVGMLRALAASGVAPDFIVGSSVGAINGGYFAGQPDAEGVARLETLWRGLRRQDVFPINLRTIAGFLRRRDFFVDSSGLRRFLETHLPFQDIEKSKIPLRIVATDVLSGLPVVLSQGPVIEAMIASSAIPAAFAPVSLDTRFLCDGAIASNTPVKVAVGCGATRLIVLPTGFACALATPPRGALSNALHALTLLIAGQLVRELENLGPGVEAHIVPPLCPLIGSPYDFSQTNELIERAARSTEEWLANGGLDRRDIPHQLRPHGHAT